MSVFDIEPGAKKQEYVSIPDFSAALPVTVIRGYPQGPNVLITAGIHNEEYVGIETANRLALELDPAKIRGTVAIIHMCNPTGFASLARDVVPEDGRNLNRCFPGSADSGPTHKLAHFITEDFIKPASVHIDLHCGGGREELAPHDYFQEMGVPELQEASEKLALLMDAEWAVGSTLVCGSAFSHASLCGIPSILMERGGMAEWSEDEVRAYLADVRRVLHRVGVLDASEPQRRVPQILSDCTHYNSEADGCWYRAHPAGSLVRRGDFLGEVCDPFGKPLCAVTANEDGVILYQLGSFSVRQGELLVTLGVF